MKIDLTNIKDAVTDPEQAVALLNQSREATKRYARQRKKAHLMHLVGVYVAHAYARQAGTLEAIVARIALAKTLPEKAFDQSTLDVFRCASIDYGAGSGFTGTRDKAILDRLNVLTINPESAEQYIEDAGGLDRFYREHCATPRKERKKNSKRGNFIVEVPRNFLQHQNDLAFALIELEDESRDATELLDIFQADRVPFGRRDDFMSELSSVVLGIIAKYSNPDAGRKSGTLYLFNKTTPEVTNPRVEGGDVNV